MGVLALGLQSLTRLLANTRGVQLSSGRGVQGLAVKEKGCSEHRQSISEEEEALRVVRTEQ